MRSTPNTFMGRQVFISEDCDVYDDVPVRWHRKKRFRKKFLKKYGTRRVLVSSDAYMLLDGSIVMSPRTYLELEKNVIRMRPTGGLF